MSNSEHKKQFLKVWGKFLDDRRFEKSELDAFCAALDLWDAESAQRPSVAGWQPIETAPRDGTRVLIVLDECNKERWVDIAHYGKDRPFGSHTNWQNGYGQGYSWRPTHWMPLPAPPITDHAGEEKDDERQACGAKALPCEVCGKLPTITKTSPLGNYSVECKGHLVLGFYHFEEQAIKAWNASNLKLAKSQLLALLDSPGMREEIINLVDKRAAVAMYENSESDTITAILDAIKKRVGL